MKIILTSFLLLISVFGKSPTYMHTNPLPPRLQWNENHGYCGEVSLIMAGLYYGQYCSQFTARALASPDVPQYERKSQLLIGRNDQKAAAAMSLQIEEWDTVSESNTDDFIAWIKKHVLANHPVTIGVFANQYLFYEDTDPNDGDQDYDHIVTVYGVGSYYPFTNPSYCESDRLYFEDHGLWRPYRTAHYLFDANCYDFQCTRQEANDPSGAPYSLNDNASNYGFAITGIVDPDGVTIPVTLTTSVNDELPEIVQGAHQDPPPPAANQPPPPMPLTLTATVSIPDTAQSYVLYMYNAFEHVPTQHFNAKAAQAARKWEIPPNTSSPYTVTVPILSNEVAVFRAVRASAP